MKPHIAQTVADLRLEQTRLADMIAVLERYGAETDTQTQTAATQVFVVPASFASGMADIAEGRTRPFVPTAPVPPEQSPPPPAAAPDPPSRRRVSSHAPKARAGKPRPSDLPKKTSYGKRAGLGAKQLVLEAIAALPDPFTIQSVREYLAKHHPEFTPGGSTISVAICNLRNQEEIRDAGKVQGPKGPLTAYKKSPKFKVESAPPPGAPLADDQKGVTDLVREATAVLVAPFSRVEVLDWIQLHYPERMAELKPTAIDGVMTRFRKSGELLEVGTRQGLTGPLTLCKRSAA